MQEANYVYWLKRDAWKLWQACWLLAGFEPQDAQAFTPCIPSLDDFLTRGSELPGWVRETWDRMEEAANTGALPLCSPPAPVDHLHERFAKVRDIVRWAVNEDQVISGRLLEQFIAQQEAGRATEEPGRAAGKGIAPKPAGVEAEQEPWSGLPPMNYEELARHFRYPDVDMPKVPNPEEEPDPDNLEKWRQLCSDPGKWNMTHARVRHYGNDPNKPGEFDPALVADKVSKWRGRTTHATYAARSLVRIIKSQPGYKDRFGGLLAKWEPIAKG